MSNSTEEMEVEEQNIKPKIKLNAEEEEETDDTSSSHHKSGKKHARASESQSNHSKRARFFVDDAADESGGEEDDMEVYEEDEDEEEEEEEMEARMSEALRLRQLRREGQIDLDTMNPEDLAAQLEERYRGYRTQTSMAALAAMADSDDEDEDALNDALQTGGKGNKEREATLAAAAAIRQQSQMPTVRDPKLWLVKCYRHQEREIVCRIMQKHINTQMELARLDEDDERRKELPPMLIKSAMCRDTLQGYIYVEALRQAHVNKALEGMYGVMPWTARLVPITEMVSTLRITSHRVPLKAGAWVRPRRGMYKQDLGQVIRYDESTQTALVRLVPRLNLAYMAMGKEEKKLHGRRRERQPPRLFSVELAREAGLRFAIEQRFDPELGEEVYFLNKKRYLRGFYIHTYKVQDLITDDVLPALEELQVFQTAGTVEGSENDLEVKGEGENGLQKKTGGIVSLSTLELKPFQKKKNSMRKGDRVRVTEGDLKNLIGIVHSTDGESVQVMPNHEELNELLSFQASSLSKYFKVGDHVKVLFGRYKDETGMVVQIKGNIAVIFTDTNHQEAQVLVHQLQLSSDVATGMLRLGQYELRDVVYLNQQSRERAVGLIVRIERTGFHVLTNGGDVIQVPLQEMGRKRTYRQDTAFDSQQHPLNKGDAVKVISGEMKGKRAVIVHLFKFCAFLHSRFHTQHQGFFVVPTKSIRVVGEHMKRGVLIGQSTNSSAPLSPGQVQNKAGYTAFRAMARGRHREDDELLNKTVRIIRGIYKGLVGIVVDSTDKTVRVELHTTYKKITVKREHVTTNVIPAASGFQNDSSRMGIFGASGGMRPNTPMRPMTPMHAPGTPGRDWDAGARPGTPGRDWDAGARPGTPGRDWDAGARPGTPGRDWDAGARPGTPGRDWDTSAGPGTPGRDWDSSGQMGGAYNKWDHSGGNMGNVATPGFGANTPYDSGAMAGPETPHAPAWQQNVSTPHVSTPGGSGVGGGVDSGVGAPTPYAFGTPAVGGSEVVPGTPLDATTPGYAAANEYGSVATPGYPLNTPAPTAGTPLDVVNTPMGTEARSNYGGFAEGGSADASTASEDDGRQLGENWVLENMEVEVLSGTHAKKRGFVRSVSPDGIRIELVQSKEEITVANASLLKPCEPTEKKQIVYTLFGETVGKRGTLAGIDHHENAGIVMLDGVDGGSGRIVMCPLRDLVRMEK